MTTLRDILATHVSKGPVPGAVGLVARGDRVEVVAVGALDADGTAPMARDSIFRIASVTKPIIAAAVMMLVDDARIGLADPVRQWLPELASPVVLRTPGASLDDVVPAGRPITVGDLLTFRAGYGFPADFSLPVVALLVDELKQGPPQPDVVPPPDEWMARLSRIPLLHQPGAGWLYNTCSDILGVLIARVAGRPLPDFLAERVFAPLGMVDTDFHVPAGKRDRFPSAYGSGPAGELELLDTPDGGWSRPPAFPSGAGGLVSTVDDLYAFGRLLLADGRSGGRQLLSAAAVRQLTTDHLTQAQRDAGRIFLEGQGWGYGGSVDLARTETGNVPGRYGWVGGTGTAAHIVPATGAVSILLTQLHLSGTSTPEIMLDFWRYAAQA